MNSLGISITRSLVTFILQASLAPCSRSSGGINLLSSSVIGGSSEVTTTRHLPQVPLPPQTESRGMPARSAASETDSSSLGVSINRPVGSKRIRGILSSKSLRHSDGICYISLLSGLFRSSQNGCCRSPSPSRVFQLPWDSRRG